MEDAEENPFLDAEWVRDMVLYVRGIAPEASALSDESVLIILAYMHFDGDKESVKAKLGCDGRRLANALQSRSAQKVIRILAHEELKGNAYFLAINRLTEIVKSDRSSAAAQVSASKALIEMANVAESRDFSSLSNKDSRLDELTADELGCYVRAIKAEMDKTHAISPSGEAQVTDKKE